MNTSTEIPVIQTARSFNWLKAITLSAVVVFLGCLVFLFTGTAVWDDAYIFYRYAFNLYHNGLFQFNAGAISEYGCTSFLWPMILRLGIVRQGFEPSLILFLASMLTGFLFLALMLYISVKNLKPNHGLLFALAFISFAIILNSPELQVLFASGMETPFVLLFFLGWIFLSVKSMRHANIPESIFAGMLGGLAYLVRPDLIPFTIFFPLWMLLISYRKRKVSRLIFAGTTIIVTVISLLIVKRVTGSFFPVAFHLKSGTFMDSGIREVYRWESLIQFAKFSLSNLFFIFILFSLRKKNNQKYRWLLNWQMGLILPALIFTIYYLFFVTQIMGNSGRFYLPLIPVLFILTIEKLKSSIFDSKWLMKWMKTSLMLVLVSIGTKMLVAKFPHSMKKRLAKFDTEFVYNYLGKYNWPILDNVTSLPDDLVIASTEIGLPSSMNHGKKIEDLSGLIDSGITYNSAWVQAYLKRTEADIIYIPHPHYRDFRKIFLNELSMDDRFELFPVEELNSYQDVALLKDGKYYKQLSEALAEYKLSYFKMIKEADAGN